MKTLSLILMILFHFQFSAHVSTASDSSVLNDAWYTMQAGSTPWGYFHEVIEKKNSKYVYRYEMVKMENGKESDKQKN